MEKIPVAAVVGPTASGKTALAVALAKQLDGEIVSADSMQIYRNMDIATAKPDAEEMQGIKHHLIDCIDPEKEFSVAAYCELARAIIADIHARGKLPIIAGGTGLYVDSLLTNRLYDEQHIDPVLRAQIIAQMNEKGMDAMLEYILSVDPESYYRLCVERNPRRIVRCIEVYRQTGLTQTELNHRQERAESPYKAAKIGLSSTDREYLYDRINRRVDIMMERGLLDEARQFYSSRRSDTAAAAIGYKELFPYIRGELDLDTCVENLKRATRRYAKRQLTWFTRDRDIRWYMIDETPFDKILGDAVRYIKEVIYE